MKSLFIPVNSLQKINPSVLYGLKTRLSISISTSETGADYALPIFCRDTEKLVKKSSPIAPLSAAAHGVLTDKLAYKDLPVLSLPTILPLSASDLISSPLNGSKIFVKRRYNYQKDSLSRAWNSVQEFIDSVPNQFWLEQQNPVSDLGACIFQKCIEYPYYVLGVNISINSAGDVYFWDAHVFEALGKSAGYEIFGDSFTYTADYSALKQKIELICHTYELKSGFHCIEFVMMDNDFYLLDWNTRITYGLYLNYMEKDFPVLDAPISHMMSIPYATPKSFYAGQRNYRNRNLPKSKAPIIASCGLHARFEESPDVISRISGIAENKLALDSKFQLLESKL